MAQAKIAYIAKTKCGCIVGACMDNPKHAIVIAEDVLDWLRRGYSVERVEASEDRPITISGCWHEAAVRALRNLYEAVKHLPGDEYGHVLEKAFLTLNHLPPQPEPVAHARPDAQGEGRR